MYLLSFAMAVHKQWRTVCVNEGGCVPRTGSLSDLSCALQVAATWPNMNVPLADLNKNAMMVNFLGQLGWPIMGPDIWPNIILGISMQKFFNEID